MPRVLWGSKGGGGLLRARCPCRSREGLEPFRHGLFESECSGAAPASLGATFLHLSLTHSLPPSLFLAHTRSLSLSFYITHTLSHTHKHTLSLSHTPSLTRTNTHNLSLTHPLSHAHTLSLSLTHTPSLTRTNTHTLSHTHTRAHTHAAPVIGEAPTFERRGNNRTLTSKPRP